jgi:hypothetical protein
MGHHSVMIAATDAPGRLTAPRPVVVIAIVAGGQRAAPLCDAPGDHRHPVRQPATADGTIGG